MLTQAMRGTMRTWLYIQDHFHIFPPEWDHCIEASQIEIIFNEILRNLAKVFVPR